MEIIETVHVGSKKEIPEAAALLAGALQVGDATTRWWTDAFTRLLYDRASGDDVVMAVQLAKVFTRWQVCVLAYQRSDFGGWSGALYLAVYTPSEQTISTGMFLETYHPTAAQIHEQMSRNPSYNEQLASKALVRKWYNLMLAQLRKEQYSE